MRKASYRPPRNGGASQVFDPLLVDALIQFIVADARYGSYNSNIFMRMQDTEIPREEEDPYLLIPGRLPPPDDFLVDNGDQRYLQMFLEKGRSMIRPLAFFFPTACEQMFKTSFEHTRLRNAIVAIAMHYS